MRIELDWTKPDPRPNWAVLLRTDPGLIQWTGRAEDESAATDAAMTVARITRTLIAALTGERRSPVDEMMSVADGEDVPPYVTLTDLPRVAADGPIRDLSRLAAHAASAAIVAAMGRARLARGELKSEIGLDWLSKIPYGITLVMDPFAGGEHVEMDQALRDALIAFAIAQRMGGGRDTSQALFPAPAFGDPNAAGIAGGMLARLGLEREAAAFMSAHRP